MTIYKKVNKNLFKKWTPEMAYVLGFFVADGTMTTRIRGAKYFDIQICDRNILEEMKKAMGSDHKISIGNRKIKSFYP